MTVPSGALEYRHLRRSDLPAYRKLMPLAIGRLERSTGLDENGDLLPATLARWPIWAFLRLLQLFGRPFLQVHVAADGSRLVGTATLIMLRNTGYVVAVATEPEYRGRGIASHLLEQLRTETGQRRRKWIALDVESENETAVRVYRRAGYREVARFAFYRRPGLPAANPTAPSIAPATRKDLKGILSQIEASRGPEYRAALPASARILSHVELIIQGGRGERETWLRRGSSGATSALRAYFVPATRMGALFPLTREPETPPDGLAALLEQGIAWLRSKNPVTCLAVVPEPIGSLGPLLESLGFARVVSATTMASPVPS
jgi:ribosomal protein S18 acetylase RimI-like enzyme